MLTRRSFCLFAVLGVVATACGGTYHPETPDIAALVQVSGSPAPVGDTGSAPAAGSTAPATPRPGSTAPATADGQGPAAPGGAVNVAPPASTPTAAPTGGADPNPATPNEPEPEPSPTSTGGGGFPVADIGADRPANASGKILLGIVGPHTGPIALQGLASLRGVQAVVAHYNASGGIQGVPIELLVEDDQFDPAQGRRHVQRMINENQVFALMGLLTPATFAQSLPDVDASGTIMMLGDGAASTGGSRLVFPSYQKCPTAMAAATEYAIRDLGFDSLAIMELDIEVSRSCADAIAATADAMGARIAERTAVTPGGIGCDSQAQNVASSGAQTTLIQAETLTMIRCTQALRQAGFTGAIGLSANAVDDDALVDALGDAADGIYSTSGFLPKTAPETRAFCTDIIDTYYPDSGATQYLGYGACAGTRALLDALAVLGPDATAREVIGYFETQPYSSGGMGPPMEWSRPDHEPYRQMIALQITDGIWTATSDRFVPAFGS